MRLKKHSAIVCWYQSRKRLFFKWATTSKMQVCRRKVSSKQTIHTTFLAPFA